MLGLLGEIPIAVVVIAGVFAPLASWMAMRRSRNAGLWFVYGALTGPVAAVILAVAPPGRCPECDSPVTGWPGTCALCRAPLSRIDLAGEGDTGAMARPASGAPTDAVARTGALPSPRSAAGTPTMPVTPTSSNGQGASGTWAYSSADAGATVVRAPAPQARPGRPSVRGDRRAAAPQGEVHATGIYLSGNAGMTIGALYAVARVDDRIRVFGPVDVGDHAVRFERPLAEVQVAAIDDRIVITGRSGRSATSIVLRAAGGKRGAELEGVFGPAGAIASSDRPAGSRP